MGIFAIDNKLGRIVREQQRHNKAFETLLTEIRDRLPLTLQR
jgi:hypothetical protein